MKNQRQPRCLGRCTGLLLLLGLSACSYSTDVATPIPGGTYTDETFKFLFKYFDEIYFIGKISGSNFAVTAKKQSENFLMILDEWGAVKEERKVEDPIIKILPRPGGGFVTVGHVKPFDKKDTDIVLRFWDAYWWARQKIDYDKPDFEGVVDIEPTQDGGYILLGHYDARSFFFGGNTFILKTDSSGLEEWSKTYPSKFGSAPKSLVQTAADKYVLFNQKQFTIGKTIQLVEIDDQGEEIWSRKFTQAKINDYRLPNFMLKLPNGSLLVAESFLSNSSGNTGDIGVICTDAQGNLLWAKSFGGRTIDRAASITLLSDGNIALLGTTESFGNGGSDLYLIKLDQSGRVLWEKSYGGPELERAYYLQETADGNLLILGEKSPHLLSSTKNLFLLKTTAEGIPLAFP